MNKLRYNDVDDLVNDIGFNGIECDSKRAETVTINEIIQEKRKENGRSKENKM